MEGRSGGRAGLISLIDGVPPDVYFTYPGHDYTGDVMRHDTGASTCTKLRCWWDYRLMGRFSATIQTHLVVKEEHEDCAIEAFNGTIGSLSFSEELCSGRMGRGNQTPRQEFCATGNIRPRCKSERNNV